MWSSDTTPSMPLPMRAELPVKIDFGGFGFTYGGIQHNLNEDEYENILMPAFAPQGFLDDVTENLIDS